MTHRRTGVAVAVLLAAAVLPAAAQAHVTVNPKEVAAGAFTVLDVRVPDEDASASTTKVVLQMPPGFASVSYQPVPGWSVSVATEKLATPVQTDDGPVDEGVSRITWTGTGHGSGRIAPGQFMDFPLSVQIPGKAGDTLTFKALQTYGNGKVVRWIGAPDAETPAPTVKLTAPGAQDAAAPAPAPATSSSSSSGDGGGGGGSDALGVIAIVVAAIALAAGGAALLRRRPASPPPATR